MAAAGRHPGAVRRLPGDGAAFGAGRVGQLWLGAQPLALVLGRKLYLLAAPDGMPVAWGLATPRLGEREVAAELLGLASDHGLLRQGIVIAADKGLAGHRFAQGVGQLGAVLVRPDRRDEPHRWGSLGGIRQWIEGIIDTLKDQLGLERHGAHTRKGCGCRSPSGCWPWPPGSGSTGSSASPTSAAWSPTTINHPRQSASVI